MCQPRRSAKVKSAHMRGVRCPVSAASPVVGEEASDGTESGRHSEPHARRSAALDTRSSGWPGRHARLLAAGWHVGALHRRRPRRGGHDRHACCRRRRGRAAGRRGVGRPGAGRVVAAGVRVRADGSAFRVGAGGGLRARDAGGLHLEQGGVRVVVDVWAASPSCSQCSPWSWRAQAGRGPVSPGRTGCCTRAEGRSGPLDCCHGATGIRFVVPRIRLARASSDQSAKEDQSCHSPASNSSPSRSTVSAPAKVRASTHRSATPANGCTNGCSPPGGGTSWSASPAAAAASTTPSCGCTIRGRRRDHGCEQVRPARMARGPGVEGLVGSQPAVPHTGLRPHPSPAPVDRDGGRHDVPLHRRVACRGARDRPARLRTARTYASAEVPP